MHRNVEDRFIAAAEFDVAVGRDGFAAARARAHSQMLAEKRVSGSAVDEFGNGQRDHEYVGSGLGSRRGAARFDGSSGDRSFMHQILIWISPFVWRSMPDRG